MRYAEMRRLALLGTILVAVILLLQPVSPVPERAAASPTPLSSPGTLVATNRTPSAPSAAPSPRVADATNTSPLAGIWQGGNGLIFQFDQTPGSESVTTTVLNDSCTGGPRTEFITGTLANDTTLSGTMYECSAAKNSLVVNCSIPAVWSTTFNGTITNGDLINGTYQDQFWTWNVSSDGSWTNCHIAYYFNSTYFLYRIDCGLKSFQQLGDQYIADPTQRAQDIALSNQLEAAAIAGQSTPVVWSAAQTVPGGFKDKVTSFQHDLLGWGISSTVISAYRPITYQAHFADIKSCLTQMYNTVLATPGDGTFLASEVAALDTHVLNVHAFQNPLVYHAGGIEFDIPNKVCITPPFTECAHVDGLAVDMKVSDPTTSLAAADSVGALDGFCRPLPVQDANHWEYIGGNPFGSPKCSAAGVGPGNSEVTFEGESPINLLVTDPFGEQIGYNASTGTVVNDFGPGAASYSGPGTEPQVIDISSNATESGNYSVSAIGTGNGPYTIVYAVLDADDTAVDGEGGAFFAENLTGTASLGVGILPVTFPLQYDYTLPSPWNVGVPGIDPGTGSTPYSVVTPNGTSAPSASSSTVAALMFSPSGLALALESTGTGGTTSVTIPHQLLLGPYTVRANGSVLTSTTTDSDSFSTVTFQMPSNASSVTIQGTTPTPPSGAASSSLWLVLALVGLLAVAAVAIGVAFVIRRGGAGRRPPPPPPSTSPGVP